MAVRTGMAQLIAKTRDLIGDPVVAASAPQFSDQQVQDALDVYRQYVRYALLVCDPTRTTGGVLNYSDFFAQLGDWETDAQLLGPSYQTLAPATSDYITGHWTFNLAPPGQTLPVFIVGQTYDVYGAAADLLQKWAALLVRQFTFTADGATFQRSQMQQQLRQLAAEYRREMRPQTIRMTRDDTNDSSGYSSLPSGLIGLDW